MPEPIPARTYSGCALPLAEALVKTLAARKETLAAAESCTAGLAADFIARIPGASKVLWGSFVTYTIDAKKKMLGVPEELIGQYGAVSRSVALAMASGALEKSGASRAFAVTGLAGPDGDGSETPVGTVWIALAGRNPAFREGTYSKAKMFLFSGSRNEVREAAAAAAFEGLLAEIQTDANT